ncbi:MAG: RNA methyltransferase [Sandaracinus sp.]
MTKPLELFVSTAPGLEPTTLREIDALGLAHARTLPGGVVVTGHPTTALRLLLSLRTASHVLARVARFRADRFERLEREVREVDWPALLVPHVPRSFRASAEKSRLHHTGAIAERLARFVRESMGDDPPSASDEQPGVTIAARFSHDECTLSIDLSGAPLHRRGYRLDPGRAPLREDLAAALVLESGWDRAAPLVDPMCGSGTIAIEAALLATRTAPGLARDFAIERTKLVTASHVEAAREKARAEIVPLRAPVVASDRDEAAARRTRANAERAGMAIEVAHAPLSETPALRFAGARPAVVTNPPWGERLTDGGAGLERLHAALGDLVRALGPEARLAMIAHDPRLARRVGLSLRSAFLTDAGGMKVHALVHP